MQRNEEAEEEDDEKEAEEDVKKEGERSRHRKTQAMSLLEQSELQTNRWCCEQ